MTKLLEFLIVQLKTVDGLRGTGKAIVKAQLEFKRAQEEQKLKKSKSQQEIKIAKMSSAEYHSQHPYFDQEKFEMETALYLKVFQRFNMLRIRMKISYMALCKQLTVKEFLLEGILSSYNKLNIGGYIRNPWPKADD